METTGGDTLTISGKGKMADYGNVNDIPWVNYRDNITEIVIEEGVESIGGQAFSGCEKIGATTIGAITIPASVKTIGNDAFYDCISLTTVTFAENSKLESIGKSAFKDCGNLTTVTFAENSQLETIGEEAFYSCK